MSDDTAIAKRIADILRTLAGRIEKNPDLLKDIEFTFQDLPVVTRRKKVDKTSVGLDIFRVFADGGVEALRQKLDQLDLQALKRVIAAHGFDPSKLAEKWRRKERLINLIMERVARRSDKGSVFREYQ